MKRLLIKTSIVAFVSSLSLLSVSLVNASEDQQDLETQRSLRSAQLKRAQQKLDEADKAVEGAKKVKRKKDFSEKWEMRKAANKEETGKEKLHTDDKVEREAERAGNNLASGAKKIGKKLKKAFH